MAHYEHSHSSFSRRGCHRGKPNRGTFHHLPKQPKNRSLVGNIEILFAEIDSILGNNNRKLSRSKDRSSPKRNLSSIFTNDQYDELDLWLLRLSATFESIRYTVFDTYQIYKKKITQLLFKLGFFTFPDHKINDDDNIQALTMEIEKIFGGRLRKFGAHVDLHQSTRKKQNLSAEDFRNELERLLKADSVRIYDKEVA